MMFELTLALWERSALVILVVFMFMRQRRLRSLLHDSGTTTRLFAVLFFGLMSVLAVMLGIAFDGTHWYRPMFFELGVSFKHIYWIDMSVIPVMIASMFGGAWVGVGAALFSVVIHLWLGSLSAWANALCVLAVGLMGGPVARLLTDRRFLSSTRAFFIGIFPPFLQMALILASTGDTDTAIRLTEWFGLPLVVVTSSSLAVFTAIMHQALVEEEQEAALETKKALSLAQQALPFLSLDNPWERGKKLAQLLYEALDVAAVSVTDESRVLAHIGDGEDHHVSGERLKTNLSKQAIEEGTLKVAYRREEIECSERDCPLMAAIIIPLLEGDRVVGLIKLYFRSSQHIRPVELALAQGLADLLSRELSALATRRLKELVREAELSALQTQVQPHVLFNTLHVIAALIRTQPERARDVTVKLGHVLRYNLRQMQQTLVPLRDELAFLSNYWDIVEARFPNRYQLIVTLPDTIYHKPIFVPPASIQPLVENSLHHGLNARQEGGWVRVDIELDEHAEQLTVRVRDNGIGFASEVLTRAGKRLFTRQKGSGIGLYNVNQRLIRLFGPQAELMLRNLPEGGGEVMFTIPCMRQEHLDGHNRDVLVDGERRHRYARPHRR